ncbi:FG-GAP-like repeat-containing protein [Paenibacillus sp. GCM10012307]|uniref:VCBS repeat-containing protein n=1 Tax=Paenibacillus roseus TaxID=2798579 RepID=A0A934MRH0_9BACL|nr:FG-GAP-like repeat-containing protein [Paenibacillus roseus]MBJ6362888.1 VCBS repeat-containing protein [Paenibacillus roseus]
MRKTKKSFFFKLWMSAISVTLLLAPLQAFAMPLFENGSKYGVGIKPFSVATSDVNGDGFPDLVTANYASGTVSVLLGEPDGTFAPPADYVVDEDEHPQSVVIGDFNGDSKPDIAVGSENKVSILYGAGDGSFGLAVHYIDDRGPYTLAAGDFNRDNITDLVVVNYNSTNVSVLLGSEQSGMQLIIDNNPSVGNNPIFAAVGDFDGDGNLDLAIANESGAYKVSILSGSGDGKFQTTFNYEFDGIPSSLAIGDFNGDEKLDVAVADRGGNQVSILHGAGDGTFELNRTYAVGTSPSSIAAGDFNDDGKPDLAVANLLGNSVSILLNKGDGPFAEAVNYVTDGYPASVIIGDFNVDGHQDVAVANFIADTDENHVSVLPGNGDGTLKAGIQYVVGDQPLSTIVADFNGDGKLDAAVANFGDHSISLLLGKGDGKLEDAVRYAVGRNPISIAVGDFNGDRKPDIVVANSGQGGDGSYSISVLRGKGDGTFESEVHYPVSATPRAVVVGDFNGDGKLDVAVAHTGTNTISVLLGAGDGTFPTIKTHTGDGNITSPRSLVAADFNNDGKLDLAIANVGGEKKVYLLEGKEDGTFQAGENTYGAAGSIPYSLAVGDFNQDGRPDIAVASANPNQVSVLLNKGDMTFESRVAGSFPAGQVPVSVAVGDFNGDGNLDLAAAIPFYNRVSVLEGDGAGDFAAAIPYSTGDTPQYVVTGDLNGDDKSDIIAANLYGNNITVLRTTPSKWKVRLSSSTSSVNENGGNAVVSVQREGSSSGVSSVSYSTVNGTAQAGVDYTATSGVVHFADGETSQTITIPILNDNVYKGNRTFSVKLSNPTADTVLSAPTAVVVTIVEDEQEPGTGTPYWGSGVQSPKTIEIVVDGVVQSGLATSTIQKIGDQSAIIVTLDHSKIIAKLSKENNKLLSIPVTSSSDIVISVLNGELVKVMEDKGAAIEIKTDRGTYTLPAAQINIAQLAAQLGQSVKLEDIKINITISKQPQADVDLVNATAKKDGFTVAIQPIGFEITASYGGKTVPVNEFNGYVERQVFIPQGTDVSQITTGVVVNLDGTVSHVPTKVVENNGQPYAVINSLTNSSYAVIWNPKSFADVEKHWSKADVNDMGARLIIKGVSDKEFQPDLAITRAEFTAIISRALGLKTTLAAGMFTDVATTDWFKTTVNATAAYGLITGYTDGTFRPNQTVSRQEAAAILAKAMKMIKKSEAALSEKEMNSQLDVFKDDAAIGEWAREALASTVKAGLLKGYNDKLAPKENVTRAQAAAMVRRLLQTSNLIN